MNWGVKILVTLITIVVVTVSVGIYMVSQDTDSLVEEGYYEKGLDYETFLEHKRNVDSYNAQPEIVVRDNYVELQFKEGTNEGEIMLRRSSDQTMDKVFPFISSNPVYTLSLKDIAKGAWEIEISWTNNNIPFFYQKRIYLQ